MMTKDEERAVLRKIEKLIKSTEEGSYIRAAFEGCIEDAEENITNDWACSWKDRAASAEHRAEDAEKRKSEAEKAARAAQAELEVAKATVQQEARRADKYCELYTKSLEARNAMTDDTNAAKAEAEALRQQIIELKARLYDFMTQG